MDKDHMEPQPGDAVVLDGEYWGAKRGQIATVDGMHYHWLSPRQVMLVFAYSAYRENGVVECSGGPCPFVDIADLTLAGSREITFWHWPKNTLPAAGAGVNYSLEVPLWSWNGHIRQWDTVQEQETE